MKPFILATICITYIFIASMVSAQGKTYDDVRLFQAFFRDTPISLTPYGEAIASYDDYDQSSSSFIGIQGGFPLLDKLEIGTKVGMIYLDPDNRGSETDLSDCMISGRYNISEYMTFLPDGTKTSAGAYVTLPVGSEDVGEDNTDYGAFAAIRHPIARNTALTGVVGFDWLETANIRGEKDRDFSLLLGVGAIYSFSDQIHVVGEINHRSEDDYMLLTGGVDYELKIDHHLRTAIGAGLDDGAPDFTLTVSYLIGF
ncbi:MAG: outer membrane beta-barrel protein [Deltaproteobacteria bacterium]|nr:outer membrane beta-barrel protein [Deltaproteobacteria bacterium]